MKNILLLILGMIFIATAHASVKPLPADQAFIFSPSMPSQNQILLNWQIAPKYYLYTKKLQITFDSNAKAEFKLPQGEFQYDKAAGKYEAYSGNVSIPILLHTNAQKIQMKVDYQGCSHAGFCYPPMQKNLTLNLNTLQVIQNDLPKSMNASSLLTNQEKVKSVLETKQSFVTLMLFLGLGILLAFTPCVLPMIPILTGIIIGQQSVNTKRAFSLSFSYVLGMAFTYALIGMIAASMGSSLQIWLQKPIVILMTSLIFIMLALSLFGFYELRLPHKFQTKIHHLSNRQKTGTLMGVFLMGVLSTLIVSPCVTAPLVGVLMYIAETGNLIYGASALFILGLGMGLPLLVIGSSLGKYLPKTGPWMEAIKKAFGLLMIAMAIWLSSRIVSETIAMLFWGVLLLLIAFFFAMFLPRLIGKHKINRGLGLGVGAFGLLIMFGAINPHTLMPQMNKQMQAKQAFIVVRDINDLNKQLALAQAQHQPVILDFYADWCESCIAMDKKVFSLSSVQQHIQNYVLLRADLSGNTSDDEALLKQYHILAPPTVLFFDRKGQEVNSQRIVGEVNAKEFLQRLNDA